jgi:hypothetical protein
VCDYSLYEIPNRLAVEREELVAHRFPTGSMGLAAEADLRRCDEVQKNQTPKRGFWATVRMLFNPPAVPPVPAVCVPPGARLILKEIPQNLQRELGVSQEEGVTFAQTSIRENSYRDALRFKNGAQIRLQDLCEGQRVEVLSLAALDVVEEEFEREEANTRISEELFK